MESKKIQLDDAGKYFVTIAPAPKGMCTYSFYQGEQVLKKVTNKEPTQITSSTTIWRMLKDYIDPNNYLSQDGIKNRIDNQLLPELQTELITIYEVTKELEEDERTENEKLVKEKMAEAEKLFKKTEDILLYIGSLIEWLTAGERNNILLCFLAYCSQVILRNPISVIALGEAGSGKTHIEEVALSLIPEQFVLNEKNITMAALFRRAELDEHFYDGKIVKYGDMGGTHDQQDMEDPKNIMKELQTDGYVNRPVATRIEGEWIVEDLTLKGTPCLTYTTVPNYEFDDQELSRSILVTPRLDNKEEFYLRDKLTTMGGHTEEYLQQIISNAEIIKYLVLYLREKSKYLRIVNLYKDVVKDLLRDTPYYKRDYPKYNKILEVIAIFNLHKKQVVENKIFVDLEDVQLFLSLLDKYKVSIGENLSLHASQILNELLQLEETPVMNEDGQPVVEAQRQWTVNDYLENSKLHLNKRSVQKYFQELNHKGFIRVVNVAAHRQSVYEINSKKDMRKVSNFAFQNDEKMLKIIEIELGEEICDMVKNHKMKKGLNIMNWDENLVKPAW